MDRQILNRTHEPHERGLTVDEMCNFVVIIGGDGLLAYRVKTMFQIERIQNLTLYKQYQAMKRQMEDTMPNDRHCERTHLWHGTKSEAVDGINKYGFKRSYSDLKSEFLS